MIAYVIIGTIILILDQLSKFFLSQALFLGQSIPLIKNILHLTLVYNTGAAFGIFKNQGLFFIIISLAIIGFIIFYWRKNLSGLRQNKCLNLGLVFILAGAVGNLIDRVRFGYVIDFLDFRIWPVFNLADSAITIGAGLVIWQLVIKKKSKGL